MTLRARIIQFISIVVVQAITLGLLAWWLPGLQIVSVVSALVVAVVFIAVQAVFWWAFITFFAWLPAWLYPIVTFILSGLLIVVAGNFVPGITILSIGTGIWIAVALTAVNAILGGLLSLDIDEQFDRNVTGRLVKKFGTQNFTDKPGFIFLEIDGLSEKLFRRALDEGHMPTLKRWLDEGSHTIQGWETDFTAQTGAMQTGILMGNNDNIPAYRWWDREQGRIVMSGDPRDTKVLEAQLSSGRGLLSDGGASRGNMFSGDASESILTFATLLDSRRERGPGFYLYLFSPYVIARLLTRYFIEVAKEWWQAWQQKRRKDKYIVSARNPFYAFFRAGMGVFLQDLITYTVISDMVRGVPAVYALYAGYDDLGHFAGMQTPEAFGSLAETDRYFARIETARQYAPRPYHLVVLSDHGQSEGPTFKAAHGVTLEELVKGLVGQDETVFATLDTNEGWDNVNAFLSESVNDDSRMAGVLRTMLKSKTKDGMVSFGPERESKHAQKTGDQAKEAKIVVVGSGCTGLINFADAKTRLTYEVIQERYPELILGLARHPGVGFVLVRSAKDGDMVLGEGGIYFLDNDTVEGENPLAVYGPNAAQHLKRESSFENCPDLIVNTKYDPKTEELCGFENQVSHHGGLGGPQNYPFILHPATLPLEGIPLVGATRVHRLLRGWRDAAQNTSGTN